MDNENEQPAENEQESAAETQVAEAAPQTAPESSAADAAAEVSPQPEAVVAPELSDEERWAHTKKALESLLFITDHPLSLHQLCKMVGVPQKQSQRVIDAIAELRQEMEAKGSAVQIVEVADGFQMGTKPAYAPFVKKLYTEKMTMKLSTAAHETLAIISYKQPLTRAEIEQIRGVEVIAALETLLEKRLIEVVGRRETVGRPLLYGTTTEFLRHFGLRSLEDLPPLDSFTVENAPLGEKELPAEALSPGEAALAAPAPMTEASESEDLPSEADQRLSGCAEVQAKEFAAGEAMAAAATEAAATEAAEASQEAPSEEPRKKTIWD